jgi:hypothetical protein
VECQLKWGRRRKTSIANHPLLPTQTEMCPLCSRLRGKVQCFLWCLHLFESHKTTGEIDGLGTKQTNPSQANLTAFPISPQHRSKSRWWLKQERWRNDRVRWGRTDRPEDRTDPPWFERRSCFLTLRFEQTGTTIAQTSTVENAQRAIGFWLMNDNISGSLASFVLSSALEKT